MDVADAAVDIAYPDVLLRCHGMSLCRITMACVWHHVPAAHYCVMNTSARDSSSSSVVAAGAAVDSTPPPASHSAVSQQRAYVIWSNKRWSEEKYLDVRDALHASTSHAHRCGRVQRPCFAHHVSTMCAHHTHAHVSSVGQRYLR